MLAQVVCVVEKEALSVALGGFPKHFKSPWL